MNDETLNALIDALDSLNVYLMANWDEHARRRVRQRFQAVEELLRQEQKRRKGGTSAA